MWATFFNIKLNYLKMNEEIQKAITEGIAFKKGKDSSSRKKEEPKIKTKAKKTTYIKGTHGSGSAKMKAEYRRKRATRHKK